MSEPNLVSVSSDTYNDCPVLNKDRVITMYRGVCATLEFQLHDRQGSPLDFSAYVFDTDPYAGPTTTTAEPGGQVIFRFRDAFGSTPEIIQVVGWAHDAAEGLVRVDLPSEITDQANIYRFNVAITDVDGHIRYVDQGLLSVEQSLFADGDPVNLQGPLTLNEIRLSLRDTIQENDLHEDFEFSDAEIITCIMRPLQEWNEQPPSVATFTARDFPFRHHWLLAVTGYLLRIAAHWYRRNKLQATHGGIQVDDKNKDQAYLEAAQLLLEEWRKFIRQKKIEINIQLASGVVHSRFGYTRWF